MAVGGLDAAFFPALDAQAKLWGTPPSWFLLAGYLESRLDPAAHRDGSGFWGLSQLNTADVRRYAGVDGPTYLTLQASEQFTRAIAPWYTAALAPLGRPPRSPGAFYSANLAPAILTRRDGDAPTSVLYAAPSREYYANKPLDVNGDGAITVGDLDAFEFKLAQEKPFLAALAQLDDQTPPYGAAPSDPRVATAFNVGVPIALGAVGGLAIVAGLAWFDSRRDRGDRVRRNPAASKRSLYLAGGALALGAVGVVTTIALASPSPTKKLLAAARVFPLLDVPGANIHFTDDWNADRVGHKHQGNDLFAALGTPIVAPEDGRVTFTDDGIPGPPGCPPPLSFHLQGRSGVFYFGTHLASFEGGALGDSRDVIAGEKIGTVGKGGNACGTDAHLHYETHAGGVPIDPYPSLMASQRLTEAVA